MRAHFLQQKEITNILTYVQLAQHLQSLVTKWQCMLHLLLVLLKTDDLCQLLQFYATSILL